MTTATSIMTPTARDYFRVSKDDSGRERSPVEQAADNRTRWAGELAFNGESYAEAEAVSASRFASKNRGGFERLMSDLRAGRFGADTLALWEPSRGSRKVGEWCDLIDLCHQAGVKIAVTTHGRIYDPANHRDRRTLQEDAIDAEYESGKTSDRVLRAMSTNAREGRPHGRIPFGYRRRYDPETRQLVAQEPHPDEAPLVAELFDRLRQGHSLRGIAQDWQERSVEKRSGGPFTQQHLRGLALSDVYGGRRTHHGDVTAATWPPLVPATTFHAVRRMLNERKVGSARSGRAKHLLSGIAVCDTCGGTLSAERRGGRWVYRCSKGRCTVIDRDELDNLAEAVFLAYLSVPHRANALTADDDAEIAAARDAVATAKTELDDLYAEVERGEVTRRMAAADEARLTRELQEAEAKESKLSTPSRLRQLIQPGAEVERRWRAAPVSARRDIARLLASPELLGEIRVGKAHARGEITERVAWRTA